MKDFDNSKLYSIDYSKYYFADSTKECGHFVYEHFNNLTNKWELYTGGIAAKFIEKIGGNIDLCILDTMHLLPGEILDFLMVLPFLKKNATVIIHDVILSHFDPFYYPMSSCNMLFSSLKGEKYTIEYDNDRNLFCGITNIGAVRLDDDILDRVTDYFYLLTNPWSYMPTEEDFFYIKKIFSKYYNYNVNELFNSIISFFKMKDKENKINKLNKDIEKNYTQLNNKIEEINNKIKENKNWIRLFGIYNNKYYIYVYILGIRITLKITKIAWWIPVKKWRDNFRNKFITDQTRPDQTRPDQTRPDQTRPDQK
ncbi:class I SAM-dependent methyltransferase [Brachyspira hampsonii]|uniref:class I SAM-dependent methyltransferase n=1 Tax=Brachyspira hampsonii TaxID=1287055 RepID=UPI002159DECB|nr:class I SAM-dependent methyltransferase [Brachyspira hampsonii]